MAGRTGPTKPDPDQQWLTVPEACWLLRKSTSWLYARLNPEHPQHVPSTRAGNSRLFHRGEIEAWLERQKVTAA